MKRNFPKSRFKGLMIAAMVAATILSSCQKEESADKQNPVTFQFVYTSDSHFGITRATFRGMANESAK